MTGTTITTGQGLGLCPVPERIKCRNATAASVTALKGEVWTFDLSNASATTIPLYPPLDDLTADTSEPGTQFNPYASALELIGSAPRQSYPHMIAAENILPGHRGYFWLRHPDILVKTGLNNTGTPNHVVNEGLPLIPDYTDVAERRLIWMETGADIPATSFVRHCGWSLQAATPDNTTDEARFIQAHFDGYGLGCFTQF